MTVFLSDDFLMEAQYSTLLSQWVSAEKPLGVAENFKNSLTGQVID
jgi:hypothetical protein